MSPTQRVGTKQAVTSEIDKSGVVVLGFHYKNRTLVFQNREEAGRATLPR